MRCAAMPEGVCVGNAEAQTDHVQVGKHGCDDAGNHQPWRYALSPETDDNGQWNDSVGQNSGHDWYLVIGRLILAESYGKGRLPVSPPAGLCTPRKPAMLCNKSHHAIRMAEVN